MRYRRRYGHVITTSIANEAERAFWEGAHAAWKAAGVEPNVGMKRKVSEQMVRYADEVHDKLTIPRTGSV